MRVIFVSKRASPRDATFLIDRPLDTAPREGDRVFVHGQQYVVAWVEWHIGKELRYETPDAWILGDHVIVTLR